MATTKRHEKADREASIARAKELLAPMVQDTNATLEQIRQGVIAQWEQASGEQATSAGLSLGEVTYDTVRELSREFPSLLFTIKLRGDSAPVAYVEPHPIVIRIQHETQTMYFGGAYQQHCNVDQMRVYFAGVVESVPKKWPSLDVLRAAIDTNKKLAGIRRELAEERAKNERLRDKLDAAALGADRVYMTPFGPMMRGRY